MSNSLSVPLIELERVTKSFGGRRVLHEVSLTLEHRAALALIGRNGSGKSTLLSVFAGLVQPTHGRIVRSKDKLVIGYAPEAFPGLKFTPEQYLTSMGRIGGLPQEELGPRITKLLEVFHLEPFRFSPMAGFSKGMLQKVNLIQSLLQGPELLLLDEPLSGLDIPAQHSLIELLLEQKQSGTTLIFSVHETLTVEALADSVLVLQAGKTVMKIANKEGLLTKPSTYITCSNLPQEQQSLFTAMPGYISAGAVECHEYGPACTGLTVESSCTDQWLRCVLDAGASVISVEPRSSLSGLREWMDPKDLKEGTA